MLWATSAGAIYRTADPVAPLEPVEGLRTWAVAAAGDWGAICNDGELFRIPLEGPLVAEPMGRPCEAVESTRGRIFVQDAAGWSSTSDLEEFKSGGPELGPPRPGVATLWPGMDPIVRIANAWRTTQGVLMDLTGPLLGAKDSQPSAFTPHELGCERVAGVRGLRTFCNVEYEGDVLYEWGEEWNRTYVRPGDGETWWKSTMSRFSEAVVFEGECNLADDLDPNELAVCLLDDEGRTRAHAWVPAKCTDGDWPCDRDEPARDEDFQLVALESELLIYSVVSIAPAKAEFFLLDLREDSGGPLPACDNPRIVGPTHLQCTPDGAEPKVFSRSGTSFVEVPLPEGARWAGFASASRGMAAGPNAASVWTTLDGGESWQPLEVDVSGAPSSLPLAPVACTNIVCAAGPVMWVEDQAADDLELESAHYVGFERTVVREPASPWAW